MNLQPAMFVAITDQMVAMFLAVSGVAGQEYGAGDPTQTYVNDWGLSAKKRETDQVLFGTSTTPGILQGDPSLLALFAGPQNTVGLWGNYQQIAQTALMSWHRALKIAAKNIAAAGVSNEDTLATYWNTGVGGPWLSLLAPQWASLYPILANGATASALNLYSPPIANMATVTHAGAFTGGSPVAAGSYAGAALLEVTSTGFTGVGGAVTITGTARTSSGNTVVGRTWTAAIDNTGAQSTAPAPTASGDILLSVSGITVPGGMTGGTLTVQCLVPAGRNNPPT